MNGIILINKEKEYTSHDVVAIVKKLTKSKVGHTGTLDPNATGVLPLLIGEATKTSKYLINHDKEYEVTLELGKKTTTADAEGEILEELEVPEEIFDEENINTTLKSFIGKQQQIPPIYSAIKVNGKKLYDYARQGKKVEIEPRNIVIYNIELLKINKDQKQIQFKVECSKGTYIRSLCEDIAVKLGIVGYMKELKRTKVGDFYIKDALTITELEEKIKNNDLSNIITIEQIFKNNPQINIEDKYLDKYLNGVEIKQNLSDGVYRIYTNNKFIGLGIVKDYKLKRDIVI
jgi:tRNA pseudouridine55 synthase